MEMRHTLPQTLLQRICNAQAKEGCSQRISYKPSGLLCLLRPHDCVVLCCAEPTHVALMSIAAREQW